MFFSRTLLKRHSVLPGFDLALGFTLPYLGFIGLPSARRSVPRC